MELRPDQRKDATPRAERRLRWTPGLRAARLGLVAVALHTSACAAILGFDDARDLRDGGAPDGTSTDGPAVSSEAGDGGAPASPPPPAPAVNPCDASTANPEVGVFVTPTGTNATGCGAASAPCASIQVAIVRAQSTGKTVVFLAPGTYSEWVTLPADMTLAGGWTPRWTASTDADAASVTIAPGTSDITLLADAIDGGARVCKLTIASKPEAAVQRGESLYGVFVRGPATSLELDDVVVQVVAGGDGIPGADGDAGPPGAAGGCSPPGTGQTGAPAGTNGAPAQSAGMFASQGFVASGGGPGNPGLPGNNGKNGSTGACVDCVTCDPSPSCAAVDAGTFCGLGGAGGCGGVGGSGGTGGGGGGSSVAIFVWGTSAGVTLSNCTLSAGNGGAGAGGGSGGIGGAGAKGTPGLDAPACASTCGAGTPCATTMATADAGSTGGAGGNGSRGGAGGGGAGGDSCAIAQGGGASVMNQAGTSLVFGKAGRGAGAGADGTAGSVCF